MRFSNWSMAAVLALPPLAAAAQQAQQADPADAGMPVPAPAYVSAFNNYLTIADEPGSPDKRWRAANAQVRDQDTHADPMTMPGTDTGEPAKRGAARPALHTGHGSHGGHQQQESGNAH
jgi:hypothetical protein